MEKNEEFEYSWAFEESSKTQKFKNTLENIAKSCPLINEDKNKMYSSEAETLFLKSTVRRMELAKNILKQEE